MVEYVSGNRLIRRNEELDLEQKATDLCDILDRGGEKVRDSQPALSKKILKK